ncbi:hypothetical protein KR018_000827 [Drosophila ironensis]|nr:hypothetical protein KR018_000827 [Drosophila ironensis]
MDELKKIGLFIDDIYRLRVDDPRISGQKFTLRQECYEYSHKLQKFNKVAYGFHKITESLAKAVNDKKINAIGIQNQLTTISKQTQSHQHCQQCQILEESVDLYRLKTEQQFLQRIETEQQEIINNFIVNQ